MARILCIDDEPGIQRMVRNALERDGHVVTEALGCTAGRLLVEAGGYDLALVDRRMPDGDGLDLLSLLRARMPGCIRVLMTGFLDLEAVMGAINNAEVHRVIEKPFDSQRLRQELRELLDDAHLGTRSLLMHPLGGSLHEDERALLSGVLHSTAFRLDLQPIVTATSGQTLGFEGLMRSGHPRLPLPTQILELAERLHMLRTVGRSVATRAAAWLDRLPPQARLFLNVHPEELDDMSALQSQLEPLIPAAGRVVLEITGACHDRWPEVLGVRLRRLKALGFSLALDDMAAGQSGLVLLAEAEPAFIKVDRSIVQDIQGSNRKRRLVELLCTFAQMTQADVIAGGVETDAEANALRNIGVPYMQGYLFGRPAAEPPAAPCA